MGLCASFFQRKGLKPLFSLSCSDIRASLFPSPLFSGIIPVKCCFFQPEPASPAPYSSHAPFSISLFTSSVLHVQLPSAPPPPPFPEGYVPPPTAETEKGTETQEAAAESQAPTVDPIIDQGPAKRMKF